MEHETRGVHVSAGDGIVAHVENLTAFAAGDEGRLNELLVRINALAGAPWQEIVRTLTADIAQADYNQHPRLACVSVEHDRVAALVFGDTSLSITIDGAETVLDGRDSSTWIDVALRGSVDRIHAGTQSESAVVGVLRDGVVPAGGFLLDTEGPMPASGRWSEMASAAAAEAIEAEAATADSAPEPEPVAQHAAPVPASTPEAETPEAETPEPAPAPATPVAEAAPANEAPADPASSDSMSDAPTPKAARGMFARIEELGRKDAVPTPTNAPAPSEPRLFGDAPLPPQATNGAQTNGVPAAPTAAAPTPEPSHAATLAPERPQIRGVLCPAGHLTAPNESTCRACHTHIAADAATVSGDRPVLGVLTFDDGAVLNIDRPAAIGSNVPTGYAVETEPATIVRLDDGAGGVSDVQVEVRLSGWTVEIVDMQSANGTYTSLNGERQTRTKLRPGQRVALQHDMTIETGGRSFVFTSGPGIR